MWKRVVGTGGGSALGAEGGVGFWGMDAGNNNLMEGSAWVCWETRPMLGRGWNGTGGGVRVLPHFFGGKRGLRVVLGRGWRFPLRLCACPGRVLCVCGGVKGVCVGRR